MNSSGNSDLVKVIFDLERDEDGYPPADYEYLWAKPLGGNLYELDNTPFFVRGISAADVVVAQPNANNELRFQAVDSPSGHTTLRVIVFRDSPDGGALDERVRELRKQLAQLGCSSELSHLPGLVAVDVPPTTPLDPVIAALSAGESSELWEFEEAAVRA